jgi:hypothetical protein
VSRPEFRVTTRVICDHEHEHTLCVLVSLPVPDPLRCEVAGPPVDLGPGSGTGCHFPSDLVSRVEYELRENYQESRRRGYVRVAA